MKCLSCGADNAADAKFCKSCGQPLENNAPRDTAILEPVDAYDTDPAYSYDEVEEKKPAGKKKGLVIAASVFAVIVLLVLSFFIYRTSRRISLEKSAAAAIEDENYDKAREQYDKLYDMTGRDVYKERAKDAKTMAKDQELLDEAKDAFESDSFKEALRIYTAIEEHDNDLSDKAKEGVKDVVSSAADEIWARMDADDFDGAMDMVNELIAVAPNNDRLADLKKKVKQGAQNLSEEKIRAATAESEAAKAAESTKKSAKRASEASRILYTYQYVTAAEANVRTGPGKNYPVAYTLSRGAEVYVIDTQSDSVRTWCNIGDGWISYRTLNGEF
ncbi:MAG: hypothetical protein KH322_02595 [Peptoniphilaceae bacterium]|nr:hypothetical protein [Peptoniphilaceae bacterium]